MNESAAAISRSPRAVTAEAGQTAQRRRICYFGPNGDDPAVHRRINQFMALGADVTGFTFTRDAPYRPRNWRHVDLGHLRHGNYGRRLLVLLWSLVRVLAQHRYIRGADVLYARNLDNALIALLGRALTGSRASLVYEVLDVRPVFLDKGPKGRVLRWLERFVLRRSVLLVLSAPRFHDSYFRPVLGYRGPWFQLENKIRAGCDLTPSRRDRHVADTRRPDDGVWRIGWFGYIDDPETWGVLKAVAEALPDRVAVHVRGIVYGGIDERRFLSEVEALPNVTFGGRYLNPDDLPEMMASVDMVWSDDLTANGTNSDWLLPNSLYDGGYFGKPLLSRPITATGAFIERNGAGWTLNEPLEDSLIDLLRSLTREQYEARREAMAAVPATAFVETDDVARMLDAAVRPAELEQARPRQAQPVGQRR